VEEPPVEQVEEPLQKGASQELESTTLTLLLACSSDFAK
jgi:hypothetical protein